MGLSQVRLFHTLTFRGGTYHVMRGQNGLRGSGHIGYINILCKPVLKHGFSNDKYYSFTTSHLAGKYTGHAPNYTPECH